MKVKTETIKRYLREVRSLIESHHASARRLESLSQSYRRTLERRGVPPVRSYRRAKAD